MSTDEMARAHDRDYRELDRMRALQHALDTYINNAPSRTSPRTLKALQAAAEALGHDANHVMKVWD